MTPTLDVRETITEYGYCALPEDHPEAELFTVYARLCGGAQWVVQRRQDEALSIDGTFDKQTSSDIYRPGWIDRHWFDLATAQRLAREAATTLTVAGFTAQTLLERDRERGRR